MDQPKNNLDIGALSRALENVLVALELETRHLVVLLSEEQSLLMGRKNLVLDDVLKKQSACLAEIKKLEDVRRDVFATLRESVGVRADEESLSAVVSKLSSPLSDRLRAIQARLLDRWAEVFVLNHRNATLVRHAAYYNDSLLAMLMKGRAPSGIYQSTGRASAATVDFIEKAV